MSPELWIHLSVWTIVMLCRSLMEVVLRRKVREFQRELSRQRSLSDG